MMATIEVPEPVAILLDECARAKTRWNIAIERAHEASSTARRAAAALDEAESDKRTAREAWVLAREAFDRSLGVTNWGSELLPPAE